VRRRLYLIHNLLDDEDPEVVELSATLNALAIHPERPDAEAQGSNPAEHMPRRSGDPTLQPVT
jgi:hypothetical protein